MMEERATRGVLWTFLSYASSKAVATSLLSWIGDLGFAGTRQLGRERG